MIDTAYYYPAPYWSSQEGGWIKSLLLFFDEVAILLPDYMYGRHTVEDGTLTEPLEERGLLRVLEPKEWVDQELAAKLAEIMVRLLNNGAFDELPQSNYFAELSQSRLGYGADVELAGFLVDELQKRDLARPSEDGVSVPLHPTVRTTVLVILGQLARIAGKKRDMIMHPVTNNGGAIADFIATFSRESMPSFNKVITLDLEPVTFDLASVPLDDVLQFRLDHKEAHKLYMQNLRGFMAELSEVDNVYEREARLLERRQELADTAHEIQRSTRRTLGKNLTSWSLGITGGVWSLTTGDSFGLALSAASAIESMISDRTKTVSAYSYIFRVNRVF